jgi:phage portal protein BeeE
MGLTQTITRFLLGTPADTAPARSYPFGPEGWFTFDGRSYPYGLQFLSTGEKQEEIGRDFRALAQHAYQSNGIVFSCILVRMLLFAEARFQFRQLRSGRPGDLFGTADLRPLENPEPGLTTGDMLARAEQDASLAGNWFATDRFGGCKRMRPDWVDILVGSESDDDVAGGDLEAEALGYVYYPGGRHSGRDPILLDRAEVAHYAPIPDPLASYRGMSWLTPIVREIMADQAGTAHKLRALEEGGIRNAAIKLDTSDPDKFAEWVSKVSAQHDGAANAYKRLYLAAGMDVIPLGLDMAELDMKGLQGAGETRIAAAAGVPPIVAGFSEGLNSATYSNYGQARRRFADGTMRPLWRLISSALSRLVPPPDGAELWYDDRDIPFLQEDVMDAAEVLAKNAAAMKLLVDAGYSADSVRDAVNAGDLNRLEHSGLFSVQLQPPGTEQEPPPSNGNQPSAANEARSQVEAVLEELAAGR